MLGETSETSAQDVANTGTMPNSLAADDYTCYICFDLLNDPVVGPCGHDFCKTCLEQWRASTTSMEGVKCPICRQAVIPPGINSLGICLRLKRTVEALYPEQSKRRRHEVEMHMKAVEQQRELERSSQIAAVQQMLRAQVQATFGHLLSGAPSPAPPPSAAPVLPAAPTPTLPPLTTLTHRRARRRFSSGSAISAYPYSPQAPSAAAASPAPPAPVHIDLTLAPELSSDSARQEQGAQEVQQQQQAAEAAADLLSGQQGQQQRQQHGQSGVPEVQEAQAPAQLVGTPGPSGPYALYQLLPHQQQLLDHVPQPILSTPAVRLQQQQMEAMPLHILPTPAVRLQNQQQHQQQPHALLSTPSAPERTEELMQVQQTPRVVLATPVAAAVARAFFRPDPEHPQHPQQLALLASPPQRQQRQQQGPQHQHQDAPQQQQLLASPPLRQHQHQHQHHGVQRQRVQGGGNQVAAGASAAGSFLGAGAADDADAEGAGLDWQQPEADLDMRQTIAARLIDTFYLRRPDMEASFRSRLPSFVARLEEWLYRSALSREEYADVASLEARVHRVARQISMQTVIEQAAAQGLGIGV